LNFPKTTQYEPIIYGMVLLPPTFLSLFFPHLFLKALGIAGGFADVLLFGVLPVIIVGIGRYIKGVKGAYMAPGGKSLLAFILLISFAFLLVRK
jgi:tyrosine-specific transport protein